MGKSVASEVIDCLKSYKELGHCKIVPGFENEDKPTRLKKIRIAVYQKGECLALPLASGERISTKEISIDIFLPYTMTSPDCDKTFEQVKNCLMASENYKTSSFSIGEMVRNSTVDMYVARGVLTVVEVIV